MPQTPKVTPRSETVFQSAPAIAGGRCRDRLFCCHACYAVSIRARHCWRAMPAITLWTLMAALFQSAPAIAGGRCPVSGPLTDTQLRGFNPRPPLLAGDAPGMPMLLASPFMFQSAPAIAGGRCRWSLRLSRGIVLCFNPRPPLLAGDAPGEGRYDHSQSAVSIRARHCWRAMPLTSRNTSTSLAMFQSAPAIAGGRCSSYVARD